MSDGLVLSDDAADLLSEAAKHPSGAAFFIESNHGSSLSVGTRKFIEPGSARSEARWKAALHELVSAGLMEIEGSLCSVTERGFSVAARLKRAGMTPPRDGDL